MSGMDFDDGFIAWGSKKKGVTTNFAPASQRQEVAESGAPGLRPPERKIAAAERSHKRAVKTLTKQNQLTRNLALQGIEAVDDADLYTNTGAEGAPTASVVQPELQTHELSAQQIYDRVAAFAEGDDTSDLDAAKKWQLAAGALRNRLQQSAAGSEDRAEITKLHLVACTQAADAFAACFEIRRAISFHDSIVAFVHSQAPELSTRSDLLNNALQSSYVRLTDLHSVIGSLDEQRRITLQLKELREQLAAAGKHVLQTKKPAVEAVQVQEDVAQAAVSAPSAPASAAATATATAVAPAAEVVPSVAKAPVTAAAPTKAAKDVGKKAKGAAGKDAAPTPAAPAEVVQSPVVVREQLSFTPAPTATATDTAAAVLVAPQPTELPPIPELPVDDGSAQAAFKRAVIQAMFHHNFEAVTSLLNQAQLFNDPVAREALTLTMLGAGITLLMVCAGGDQNSLVRRYLGAIPKGQRAQQVVEVRDAQGNNAIMHACALSRVRALDELLRQLHDDGVTYHAVPEEGDAASLVDVGLSLGAAQGYAMPIQHQLRSFLKDPAAYVASKPAQAAPAQQVTGPAAVPSPYGMPAVTPAMVAAQQLQTAAFMQAQFAMMAAMFQQAQLAQAQGAAQAQAAGRAGQGASKAATATAGQAKSSTKATAASGTQDKPKGGWAAAAGKSGNASAKFENDSEIAARRAAAAAVAEDSIGAEMESVAGASTTAVLGGKKKPVAGQAKAGAPAPRMPLEARGTGSAMETAAEPLNKLAGLSLPDAAAASTSRGKRGGRGGRKALFDQFKANEELFGITASYDETLYTTTLDRSTFTQADVAAADALAREIDAAESKKGPAGGRADDEEGQFSAVVQGRGKAAGAKPSAGRR